MAADAFAFSILNLQPQSHSQRSLQLPAAVGDFDCVSRRSRLVRNFPDAVLNAAAVIRVENF
jgi:hypothetical protein